MTINTIRVGTYPDIVQAKAGNERVIDGWRVEFVTHSQPHHIRFEKYTADYKERRARPYLVGNRGFKTGRT